MPRDIPVGNGSLLVNFDGSYQLRDFYWPHPGQENQTIGHLCRFGIWVNGRFHWTGDGGWQRQIEYLEETLVTQVTLQHPDFALHIVCNDAVDFHENLYIRRIVVHNDADQAQEVRLFFGQDFHIEEYAIGDSAYYEPEQKAVFHYKEKRWFVINTAKEEQNGWCIGVDQWAVGTKEAEGEQGTWRDAEDGVLSGNPVAQGSVDSTVALHLIVPPKGETTGWYWIGAGENFPEVARINRVVQQKHPPTFMNRTRDYWALWGSQGREELSGLDDVTKGQYQRSLLILRTQIDNGGAILAANDFDVVRFNSDTYSYMWPRDGALAVSALVGAGHSTLSERFFTFCHNVITDEGYLLHKYNPDGSLASSWHGWYYDGQKELPVQEDETALVLWAFWRYFQRFWDVEFFKPHYRGLVCRGANWMGAYRDPKDNLPLPSWDLWEERRGVHAWTVGATWAGLQAAAQFADAFGEDQLAASYRHVADEVRAAAEAHLWSADLGRFVRTIHRKGSGQFDVDAKVDASVAGLWYFGMFPADDPRIVATMEDVRQRLWVKTEVGGLARYENDPYHQVSQDIQNVPGNPWFICTLWLAQWHIATAKTATDLGPAFDLIKWACARALPSGVMAEQINPYTGEQLSASPLSWSHAELITTVQKYIARQGELARH